jgi:hypothetical protein
MKSVGNKYGRCRSGDGSKERRREGRKIKRVRMKVKMMVHWGFWRYPWKGPGQIERVRMDVLDTEVKHVG